MQSSVLDRLDAIEQRHAELQNEFTCYRQETQARIGYLESALGSSVADQPTAEMPMSMPRIQR